MFKACNPYLGGLDKDLTPYLNSSTCTDGITRQVLNLEQLSHNEACIPMTDNINVLRSNTKRLDLQS